MKIGVRGHDLRIQDDIAYLANETKKIGFDYIQLVPKKVMNPDSCSLNEDLVTRMKEEFEKQNIKVALLGAYFNPIHSNESKLKSEIEQFKTYLKYAKQFGCSYVGTETGSYNDDQWTYNPKNHTEEAFNQVVNVVKELVIEAEENQVYVAIEPAYNHVIHSPLMLKRLIDAVNSDHLVVIIDLFNLLNMSNYHHYKTIFAEYVYLFKERIKLFHFKDFVIENNELVRVGLGEGVIDYDYIIQLINDVLPDSIAVFEGVPENKLKSSFTYINNINEKYKQ